MTAAIVSRSNEIWAEVTRFATGLTDHERDTVRNAGGWSVKDHVAHLGAWKRSFVLWLDDRSGYDAVRVPEALFHTDDLDAINAASRNAFANDPWRTVLAEADAAHEAWMATIARLDGAALAKPLGRLTVATALPDLTWEHDLEHLGWMHTHLGRTPPMETLTPEKQERDRMVDEAQTQLENAIAFGESLPPEARTLPRTTEGWSLTDHLFHLAAWNRWAHEEIQGRPGAPEFGMTPEELQPMFPQFDAINARIHARFAGRSWEDGVAAFRAASADLETFMRRATTAELAAPTLWAHSLNEVFHDFAIHHVGEHLGWMREQAAATT